MGVEWIYQSGGFEQTPVSSEQLRQLAGQGIVAPSDPVQRVSGSDRSPWRRAGEVKGLFAGDVSSLLGDPICEECGRRLVEGRCATCDNGPTEIPAAESPPPFTPPPVLPEQRSSRTKYPQLHQYLDICKVVAEVFFWGMIGLTSLAALVTVLKTRGAGLPGALFVVLIAAGTAYLVRLLILASVQVTYVLLDIEANTRREAL